ncbi:hypothetical protein SAMD00019534_096080 [Acytostelium subglobosum LB1]|uniref:hypothetical protein n=1 Tax=Acytostelium subglobosum LB1 TaxID=1410327 RepID=UPI000644DC2B|nr:hypothetical protein SAMD00019534_096080 [Acytostelium subglobosum LB1]GAM26433.1 hypothetical protein SAMD00019534_096080 [Acytostelium subglobosum LB1]|eukprot:XP_012750529.1 hypothetical protein SAMD00019534_096080 [Acytostelium subglobosum LB1]
MYNAFSIQDPFYHLDITTSLTYTYDNGIKVSKEFVVSPNDPTISTDGLIIKLVGNFVPPYSFENRKFVMPDPSTDTNNHRHTLPLTDKSMLLPADYFGTLCNQIGIDYKTFSLQPDFCQARQGSCLDGQINDYWMDDMAKLNSSEPAEYLLSSYSTDAKLMKADGQLFLDIPIHNQSSAILTIKLDAKYFVFFDDETPDVISSFEEMSQSVELNIKVTVPAEFPVSLFE